MSQGNHAFIRDVTDPHIVTNYWKRVLREMKEPIIPFDMYVPFGKILDGDAMLLSFSSSCDTNVVQDDSIQLLKLKSALNELPDINFNTLKYHIAFFKEVISF